MKFLVGPENFSPQDESFQHKYWSAEPFLKFWSPLKIFVLLI